ncbi:unnamed protein product [Ranitomeya imitator]|uniref:Up-frameshift suppressor 2 C-terminal domain-containing protein n=1 Tax=Ranitomeya imitator TaxID=111125 RepID=A0ABN9KWB8_9NEOB|nr:unnamed protein product [Ranitomeya imitator]
MGMRKPLRHQRKDMQDLGEETAMSPRPYDLTSLIDRRKRRLCMGVHGSSPTMSICKWACSRSRTLLRRGISNTQTLRHEMSCLVTGPSKDTDLLTPLSYEHMECRLHVYSSTAGPNANPVHPGLDLRGCQTDPQRVAFERLSRPGDILSPGLMVTSDYGALPHCSRPLVISGIQSPNQFSGDLNDTTVPTAGPRPFGRELRLFQEVMIKGGGIKHVPCAEDEDFIQALDKMMLENLQRTGESVKVHQLDVAIPLHLKSQLKKGPTLLSGDGDSECGDTMPFVMLTRRGNKRQFKILNVPMSSQLAANHWNQQQAEQEERMRMKKLTLDINERQEQEDYQEMLQALAQRPAPANTNRDRRPRYQHPKGAPNADLIFKTGDVDPVLFYRALHLTPWPVESYRYCVRSAAHRSMFRREACSGEKPGTGLVMRRGRNSHFCFHLIRRSFQPRNNRSTRRRALFADETSQWPYTAGDRVKWIT